MLSKAASFAYDEYVQAPTQQHTAAIATPARSLKLLVKASGERQLVVDYRLRCTSDRLTGAGPELERHRIEIAPCQQHRPKGSLS